jgi:hypothetical protein
MAKLAACTCHRRELSPSYREWVDRVGGWDVIVVRLSKQVDAR